MSRVGGERGKGAEMRNVSPGLPYGTVTPGVSSVRLRPGLSWRPFLTEIPFQGNRSGLSVRFDQFQLTGFARQPMADLCVQGLVPADRIQQGIRCRSRLFG